MANRSNAVAALDVAALEAVRRTAAAQAATIDALEHAFDAEMTQLASDRLALEDDRAAFVKNTEDKVARDEEMQQRIRAAAPPPDELVKLNVGGARFETSRAVLTKVEDSMLGRMFGRCDSMLQADPVDGSIFIDRDGERFRLILDFLRDLDGAFTQRTICALAEAAQESMTKERDYFGHETAVFGTRPWTDGATFRPGPEMYSTHYSECGAVVAAGRVIIFGGLMASCATSLLDTQTMDFTAGPNLLTGRFGCAAIQIDDGRVLVMGGCSFEDLNTIEDLNTTEIFHLATLTFTPGPDTQSARYWCASVALDARRILVVGGENGGSPLSSTEILSLDTMAFSPGPTMATGRVGSTAISLDEHHIMVVGGRSGSGMNTTEILDIRTMVFTPGPSMGSARYGCAAVAVDARHVLVIGGRDSANMRLATTELLDVATMEFAPGPAMQAERSGVAAVRLGAAGEEPRILVVRGISHATELLALDAERGAPATRHRR